MPDSDAPPPRHHLLIAGTGRAGTSFLVRWLAAMGLQTHLAMHDTPAWDDDANAGLEDMPLVTDWQDAPYVMKSPWLAELIDELLADRRVVLDAVIVPVRDLDEAAASRVVQERHSIHRQNPWMAKLDRSFGQWGATPGGVVYSLDPMDQARLLAVSFHHLVQRVVRADVPLVLLDFPRLAQDSDYLFAKLRPVLPPDVTAVRGRAAHALLADPRKIRTGAELAQAAAPLPERQAAAHDALDAAALRREARRLNEAVAAVTAAKDAALVQAGDVAALRAAMAAQVAEHARAVAAHADALRDAEAALARLEARGAYLRWERDTILASRSWRAGRPLRLAGTALRAVAAALRARR
jgi:hypothetical protein